MNNKSISDVLIGANNWATVQKRLIEINNANQKLAGTLFEEFTYLFFKLEPSVSPEYQNVWLGKDIPIDVRKELVLANTDHGADLVLQHKDGSYHVVQCKFKNDASHVLGWTTDKLSSALAEADHAKGLIIFTNVSDVADHVREKANRKHFQLFAWQDLIELPPDFFIQADHVSKGREILNRERFTPWPHQEKAIFETIEGFHKADRGQLILPCGAGKTLSSLWIMENMDLEKTIVAVPSLALLRQFRKDWLSQQKNWVPNICICSDEKVTQLKTDEPLIRPDELGTPVTTASKDIKNFLMTHKRSIVYTTYHSLPKVAEAIKGTDIQFDLAFCDEAHKTAGAKGTMFRLIHEDKYIPIKKRLYMTATPRVVSETLKKQLNEDMDLLYDMSDPKIFGEVFYRMSFSDAINSDVLVDYQILGIGVTNEEVKEKIDIRAFAESGVTIDEIANNYALDKVMSEYEASHAVTFHSSIRKASDFKDRHINIFKKTFTYHVSGKQNTYDRAESINSFENNKPAVITNARCLTEGVDVPAIDCIYFCDPKNSKIDIVQASGRALRKYKKGNKKIGYIVVPIFHTDKETVEEAIEVSAFNNLVKIVRALCDQDERLVDEITSVSVGAERNHFKLDLGRSNDKAAAERITLLNFNEKLKQNLMTQVIDKTKNNWAIMYQKLIEYKKTHGDVNVPTQWSEDVSLGSWVASNRLFYNKGYLSSKKIEQLKEIGFVFDLHDAIWEESFNKLLEYKSLYGDTNVPRRSPDYPVLGKWVMTNRTRYKFKKLSPIRIDKLNKIGFMWAQRSIVRNSESSTWQEKYAELIKYKMNYGDTNVPTGWPENPSLAKWVYYNRNLFKKNKLKIEWIKLLNEIDFEWGKTKKSKQNKWEENYPKLLNYKRINDDTNIPPTWPDDPALGKWASFIRDLYSRKKLDAESITRLNEIGFSWEFKNEALENIWKKNYEKLLEYKKIHGNANVPAKWKEDASLATWVVNTRVFYRKGRLSAERIELLNRIGFIFELNDAVWQYNFNRLLNYKNTNGNLKIPQKYSADPTLGSLVSGLRVKFKNGKISAERVKQLSDIGFIWDSVDFVWRENYNKLLRYKEIHGDVNVPSIWPEDKSLGNWVNNNRFSYKKGILGLEKIALLNKVGFAW